MNRGPAPEPRIGIEKEDMLSLIHNSDRPFVLVNFFATWCRPCRQELPDLVALQNADGSEVKVLLVSIDKPPDAESKLRNFLTDYGVNFDTYARTRNEAFFIKQFDPRWNGRIPLTLLYTNTGRQLEIFRGLTDREEIELIVNKHKKLGS